MGYITQISTLSNTGTATLSLWFRTKVNSPLRAETIFTIHGPDDFARFDLTYSFADIPPVGTVPTLKLDAGGSSSGTPPFHSITDGPQVYLRDASAALGPGYPWIPGSNFDYGQWLHFLVTIDTGASIDPGFWGAGYTVLNGQIIDQGYPNRQWGGSATELFSMPMFGCTVGVPTVQGFGSLPDQTTTTVLADIQFWHGLFLNPNTPNIMDNFFTVNAGKATPTNPAVAAKTFGQQTYLFRGKSSDGAFFINHGTGGTFTKVGTASDFTPTPSYG